MRILILHGPNLNLLGRREPSLYGSTTLRQIERTLEQHVSGSESRLEFFQSNAEHELVERIQCTLDDGTDGIVINPAALTHTSVALRDALSAVALPFVEVHLSNPDAREDFRRRSLLADLAAGRVAGFGAHSYLLGLDGLIRLLGPAASE